MILQTETLLMRPFEERDLTDVHAYCSQKGVGEAAGWKHHETMEESRAALALYRSEPGWHAVVAKEEGRVIGHLHIAPDSEEGLPDVRELGCALCTEWQRRGVMSRLIPLVLAELFNADIETVWACCFRENEGSRRLIERCGFSFIQEGTFTSASLGRTFDSYEYNYTKTRWLGENGGAK